MKNFIEKNFVTIVLVITLLTFLKGCNDTRTISKLRDDISKMEITIQTYSERQYSKEEFERKLKIMSLETELKFIEATDRKILDVQRQKQIREELKELNRQ